MDLILLFIYAQVLCLCCCLFASVFFPKRTFSHSLTPPLSLSHSPSISLSLPSISLCLSLSLSLTPLYIYISLSLPLSLSLSLPLYLSLLPSLSLSLIHDNNVICKNNGRPRIGKGLARIPNVDQHVLSWNASAPPPTHTVSPSHTLGACPGSLHMRYVSFAPTCLTHCHISLRGTLS